MREREKERIQRKNEWVKEKIKQVRVLKIIFL